MKENNFEFNRETETFFTTTQLFDGNMARIYFTRDFGRIKKLNFYGTTYDIGLAIGRSKKELNNWYYGNRESNISEQTTYSKYGISVLIWARKQIENFIEFHKKWYGRNTALCIGGADSRRYRVYKKGLSKLGFSEQMVRYGRPSDFQYEFEFKEPVYDYGKRLVYIVKGE